MDRTLLNFLELTSPERIIKRLGKKDMTSSKLGEDSRSILKLDKREYTKTRKHFGSLKNTKILGNNGLSMIKKWTKRPERVLRDSINSGEK